MHIKIMFLWLTILFQLFYFIIQIQENVVSTHPSINGCWITKPRSISRSSSANFIHDWRIHNRRISGHNTSFYKKYIFDAKISSGLLKISCYLSAYCVTHALNILYTWYIVSLLYNFSGSLINECFLWYFFHLSLFPNNLYPQFTIIIPVFWSLYWFFFYFPLYFMIWKFLWFFIYEISIFVLLRQQ